ncbi:MAG: T9SS type A sorting domain-containing protein, partial [Bacteroidales bacterium]|nr:T9SS type A sorting domain-containing protein [Bacteroidales bacterium]
MPDTTSVDTTGTGGDTTGIATADLQQISITPNPATGTVTVRSAEQMIEIEVVDIVGASVLRQQASGLAARLDVKALPRGSYTVRIHTPLGVTSRKLILQ